MNAYRQGDVSITAANKMPKGPRLVQGETILARGEVTGHAHRIVEGQVGCTSSPITNDARASGAFFHQIKQSSHDDRIPHTRQIARLQKIIQTMRRDGCTRRAGL